MVIWACLRALDELEAHLKSTALCHISAGKEVHFAVVVPDAVFNATTKKDELLHAFNEEGRNAKSYSGFRLKLLFLGRRIGP